MSVGNEESSMGFKQRNNMMGFYTLVTAGSMCLRGMSLARAGGGKGHREAVGLCRPGAGATGAAVEGPQKGQV